MEAEGTEVDREANVEPEDRQKKTKHKQTLRMWNRRSSYIAGLQKPDGVKTFMSRGLSLCGREFCRLASMSEISILGGINFVGSSTLRLTWVLVPSMVEDFCRPK